MAVSGNRAVVEQLLADGFTHMFGNPGTVEQGLLDVLGDYPDLHYVLGLQETVCVAMADGYARATGGPALVQLHTGVGLGNGVGMLYQALRGHSPLVVVAGDAGVRYEALDAQMAVDLVAMAEPVTKYAVRVTDPGSVLRVLRRAVRIAMTPPRGPVFVALPADVLDADNTEAVVPTVFPHTESVPAPHLLAEATRLLSAARRPVILIGDGVAAAEAQQQVARVAELWGAPVWGVDSGELNMPGRHPLYRGQLGHMFGEAGAQKLAGADAVLVVGTYLFPDVFPLLESPFAPGTPIVHLDADALQIAKNHPVSLGLVGDPAAGLDALAAELERKLGPSERYLAAERLEAAREQAAAQAATRVPDTLADRFFAAVAQAAPPDLMLFDEALTASDSLGRHLPPPNLARHWFQTRGGSLGVGVPGALGIKLAHPGKTVLGVTGDGGVMYTIQALSAAARYRIGAKFVVCNNSRYRLLDYNLEQYRAGLDLGPRPAPEAFDLSAPPIDFLGLAEAQGVSAAVVRRREDIAPAVERMFADDRPFLVDLLTEPVGEGGAR
ncbi:thiamine pyrophosphate-binding protein [Actinospica robiniae]|uniref:thiamine pyrophosphate-binding protein n=1 Tax=Actinospica robiniae TaxID=304901 RepID=UPI00041F12C3|nr:thiamine pyrophosphate-binding protein [Actinospica robiniae]